MTIISTTIKSHANPREVILYPVVGQNDFQDDIFTNMFACGYTTVYEYNEDILSFRTYRKQTYDKIYL